MAKEPRPKGYPKLKNYKPSQFMLPTSHYDKKKADRAVTFIENLCHTKGKWAGTPFWLLPWQEQLIRDIFGIVKPDGNRQFRTAFVEICKKVGKSELAAAVALYLLYADNEPSAEVYGAAADRQQASIVFDVAKQMVEMSPALMKRSKLMGATKRIVNYSNAGYYQVLSAEVGGKHGFSVSGLVFDEIHTQPNRQLYDVLTKGSSDARQNPLHFIITTAGNDRHSIAYELHTKAVDILEGRRVDPTFYPVVYGLKDDEDWEDEENWYKVNPSLGFDGLVGYSPIAMAKNAIGLAIAAEEYGSKFYANGAAPSGVLEHPGTLKDPGRVRESWQSTFGGSSNANKVAVLEEGMKYTPISIAPNEAQFLETRKFQIDEIARIFRVPPHMVGDLDKSSFSNIEQQSLEFVKYTLDPWVSRWEQAMVRALLSAEEKKKYFFKFNVDGLLRGDYQSRMTGYATARQNGWMSANDIRELENMDRIPEELGGDLYLINGNMTKLQDAGIFAGSGKGKDTGEEVLELEKESGKFGKRTGS